LYQQAFSGFSGNDGRSGFSAFQGARCGVEAEFSLWVIGAMTGDAGSGQQRFDFLKVPGLGFASHARSHGREGQQPTKTMG
jgi:hypothetical protein